MVKESCKIIFTGTGSGKASLKRFHSSFLISSPDFNLLIDAGDGISKAILSQKISFNSIDGILFSHLHPDHFSGFAALLVQMKLTKREKKLIIYANKALLPAIKNFIIHSYIYPSKMGFDLIFIGFKAGENIKVNKEINFISKNNSHLHDYMKNNEGKSLSFSCSSFLFQINNKKIFYTGDIGNKNDLYLFKDQKFNFMISEITHIDLNEVVKSFKVFNAEKLFLIHISDEDEDKLSSLKDSLQKEEEKKIIVLTDGYVITL